jgi:hypothetical protein
MKFERTPEYEAKLFEQALFDEKRVIRDSAVVIKYENGYSGKLKAYCIETKTYLQFPRSLRTENNLVFTADVVEVKRDDNVRKYFRAMKGSIRDENDQVVG